MSHEHRQNPERYYDDEAYDDEVRSLIASELDRLRGRDEEAGFDWREAQG